MKQRWILVLGIFTGSVLGMMETADPQQRAKEMVHALRGHLYSMHGSPEVTAGYIQEFQKLKRAHGAKFLKEFYQDLLLCELPIMSGYVQTYQNLCDLLVNHKIRAGTGLNVQEMVLFANVRANNELVDAFIKHIKDLARSA